MLFFVYSLARSRVVVIEFLAHTLLKKEAKTRCSMCELEAFFTLTVVGRRDSPLLRRRQFQSLFLSLSSWCFCMCVCVLLYICFWNFLVNAGACQITGMYKCARHVRGKVGRGSLFGECIDNGRSFFLLVFCTSYFFVVSRGKTISNAKNK